MITRWIDRTTAYDGSQLRAHWILREFGIAGDALVAFRGPCRVRTDEMADLADVDGPGITGADMLHFVWERFDDGRLDTAILRQRLMSCIALEILRERVDPAVAGRMRREGDDLFVGDGKLTISIATRSPVSTLLHFALNVTTEGTPVATASLQDLGVATDVLAQELLERVADEERGMREARSKVRAKGES